MYLNQEIQIDKVCQVELKALKRPLLLHISIDVPRKDIFITMEACFPIQVIGFIFFYYSLSLHV